MGQYTEQPDLLKIIQDLKKRVQALAKSTHNLPGATAASRYAGATTSGAPISGKFLVGDFVVDQSGTIWVCTAAGSPGTWTPIQSNVELAYAEITANPTAFTTVAADIAGLSITFTAPARPVMLQFWCQAVQQLGSTGAPKILLTDNSNNQVGLVNIPNTLVANAFSQQMFASVRINGLTAGTSVTYKARGATSVGTAQLFASTGATNQTAKTYIQALQV